MFTRLREDIRNIIERDPAARNAWEVLSCYPGLHVLVMHRWAAACWRADFKWLGRFISQLARWFTGIEIHPGASVGRRVFIDHGFGVVIGETAVIGNDCTIYQGVTLGGTSLTKGSKRHPTLEAGVIVGAGAQILGGFTVGAGAKIGSNAVVVKSVPAGATAVGNPARIVEKSSLDVPDSRAAQIFAAYGVTANGDDPLSKALHSLIEQATAQQKQMDTILAALNTSGIACEKLKQQQQFDAQELNRLVD